MYEFKEITEEEMNELEGEMLPPLDQQVDCPLYYRYDEGSDEMILSKAVKMLSNGELILQEVRSKKYRRRVKCESSDD